MPYSRSVLRPGGLLTALLASAALLWVACSEPPECDLNERLTANDTCVCSADYTRCDGTCVDTRREVSHCGACGVTCDAGERCVDGVCCASTESRCGSQCISLADDEANCGRCGRSCSGDELCINGACTCPPGTDACETRGVCRSILDDPLNCGGCGVVCPVLQACVDGACACATPLSACGETCRDLSRDSAHCGDCDAPCPLGEFCVDGACTCPSYATRCGDACVSLASDATHCGACGERCPEGERCVEGSCQVVDPPLAASYVSRYQISVPPHLCCAELDGWPGEDSVLDEALEPTDRWQQQEAWDALIVDGLTPRVLTYVGLPDAGVSDITFDMSVATNDLDGDGSPDQAVGVRRGSEGRFAPSEDAPPPSRFQGTLVDGVLFAESGAVLIPLPADPGYAVVREPTLEGRVTIGAIGVRSIDDDVFVDDREIRFGGVKLAGWIALADLVRADLTALEGRCPCAGDPLTITIGLDEALERHTVEPAALSTCGDACRSLAAVIERGQRFADHADLDTNGDDVPDALSIGLFLTLAETTFIVEDP